MPTLPSAPSLLAPAPGLARALDRAARRWDGASVLRVEVPAAPHDALAWLDGQRADAAFYWQGRDDAEARVALGAALTLDTPGLEDTRAVRDALALLPPDARLWTTARFDATAEVGSEWAPFGTARFVLPRIEYRTDGRAAALAVHVVPGESLAEARRALAALAPAATPDRDALALPYMRRDDPDRAEWGRMLRWALHAFDAGALDKVVLARRARFLFEDAVDPVALLRRLEAATPRCFHALVRAGDRTFLTATPERLVRIDGRAFQTEAVAGTRPRAEADAADDRLRAELLDSEKDQREHGYVRDAIADALGPVTTALRVDDEASAMTLARGRHLRTGIRGTLEAGVGPLEVLRALHPTPAVGGTPTPAAVDAIARLEPFDRGLYAGPIGWIGADAAGDLAADLAVGIRSGLVEGRSLSLYSGAGIVAGSDASSEWAEIELKISDFARVLGLSDRASA